MAGKQRTMVAVETGVLRWMSSGPQIFSLHPSGIGFIFSLALINIHHLYSYPFGLPVQINL